MKYFFSEIGISHHFLFHWWNISVQLSEIAVLWDMRPCSFVSKYQGR